MRDLLKMLLRKKLKRGASLLNEKMAKQKSCIQVNTFFDFLTKNGTHQIDISVYITTDNPLLRFFEKNKGGISL